MIRMAEQIERLRHLLLSNTGRIERYTNPQKGRDRFSFPTRDRQAHGNHLLRQLEAVRPDFDTY